MQVADAIQQRHFTGIGGHGSGPSKGITVTLQDGRIFEGRLLSYDTGAWLGTVWEVEAGWEGLWYGVALWLLHIPSSLRRG